MKKSLLILISFLLLSTCDRNIKNETHLVWVKGISYGFGSSLKKATSDSKNSMGGYLVGVKYTLTENKIKVHTSVFSSSLTPTANISDIKKGSLGNGLKFQQFPVSAQVSRPKLLPKKITGLIAIKQNGSYYYPMINQIIKEKYGTKFNSKSGIIYIDSLKYIETDKKYKDASWGLIKYSITLVED